MLNLLFMTEANFDENFNELDSFINLENINDIKFKNNLFLELKNSIIPEWKIKKSDEIILNKNDKINFDINLYNNNHNYQSNFENHIINGLANTSKINEFDSEIIFDSEKIKVLKKLNDFGIQFDMRFNTDYQIKINSGEIIFPMCCVGKNRSQYLFYYLKKIQGITGVNFEVGYPSSGDELSVMVDFLSNNENINKNVLSSFFPQYKKDNFSKVIGYLLNESIYDEINHMPRSIHVFDKVLKIKQDYFAGDLKNFETHKYKENKFNIFEDNLNYLKIKILFEKYFLLPNNLIEVINLNQDDSKKISKITYICMSDKSFYNLCLCFNSIVIKYPNIKLNNIRIVYFGIRDIFQKSNIKQEDMDNFKQKIDQSFLFKI